MTKNTNAKKITISSMYIIPLDELVMQVLISEEEISMLFDYLYKSPVKIERIIRKAVKRIIHFQKTDVRLKGLNFAYNDSINITYGASYFKVILKGKEKELKEIAGKDKSFYFNWEENKQIINSA
ncbi:MAG: hypothetical protein NTZ33_15580 [Bacteroidetes bacterium]|nr:hypothetical protein [Bacteroidota bacterium]